MKKRKSLKKKQAKITMYEFLSRATDGLMWMATHGERNDNDFIRDTAVALLEFRVRYFDALTFEGLDTFDLQIVDFNDYDCAMLTDVSHELERVSKERRGNESKEAQYLAHRIHVIDMA